MTSGVAAGIGYFAASQVADLIRMKTAFIIILLGVVISVAPLNFVDPEETNLGWLVGYHFHQWIQILQCCRLYNGLPRQQQTIPNSILWL